MLYFLTNATSSNKSSLNQIIESSINNALLAVIAYDVYNDLYFNKIFINMNEHQRIISLVLLIVGFMTMVKIIQLLITNN